MAVDVQRPAAGQVKRREGMLVVVVAAADDGALIAFRHYERQRGGCHLPMVQRYAILRGHVDEHAPEPVVGNRGQQIGPQPKLGAAECRRHRVAAERDGIIPSNRLLVTGRQRIREKGDIDISLADEKSFHNLRCLLVEMDDVAHERIDLVRPVAIAEDAVIADRCLYQWVFMKGGSALHKSWAAKVWLTSADVIALAFYGQHGGSRDRARLTSSSAPPPTCPAASYAAAAAAGPTPP